ncbi:MAG: S9 family peptidase [Bacteroidetes bacterium]|nr:S9 family peptidase [Bacteroidota bacterium]
MRISLINILIFIFTFYSYSLPKRAITVDDLLSFGRISDHQISPDGKTIAFVLTYQLKSENKSESNIYLVPAAGGEIRRLTKTKSRNSNPRWMPDGKKISYISTADSGSQIWTIDIDSGEAEKITNIAGGVSGIIVSPDGKWFAFASEVFPDYLDEESNAKRLEEIEKSEVKAKIFTGLPYRIWNYWKDGKRSHLFIMPSGGGKAVDITPGDFDCPPVDLGGYWDYTFSPDSKEIAFTKNTDTHIAVSTNNDIYVIPVEGGKEKKVTENPANDSQPLYSPDGRYLAYLMMKRAGFEADRRELVLYERKTGRLINLTENFDRSVKDVVWSPDSKSLFFNADDKGNVSVFNVKVVSKKVSPILTNGWNSRLVCSPGGKHIIIIRESSNMPAEIFTMDKDGKNLRQITSVNSNLAREIEMNTLDSFWFKGAQGADVNGFLLKPPFFDPQKKYPAILLVHGGPQGQWGDDFHYRWNSQMFASRGYVVIMINPRGSTGYGQKFTDEVSKDWGGRAYVDLMNGLDYVVRTYPFVDSSRIAGAGASYGGYMMNWIIGHTDRLRCVISHDGMFNPASAYGTTEELWFNEWEFGGTPYDNPELYYKFSPMEYVKNFKTPALVIHGQNDYRLDVSEGFQLFTALQRQGVKSKMLYFPDEGHWIIKPLNVELWYKTVLDWIDENTR